MWSFKLNSLITFIICSVVNTSLLDSLVVTRPSTSLMSLQKSGETGKTFPVALGQGGEIRDTKTLNLSRNMSKFVSSQVASLMKKEQQSQNLLLKVDPRSTFCNDFVQPVTCCATS